VRRFKCTVTTFQNTTKSAPLAIAQALAHELGHVFGLPHTHSPGRAFWQTQNADNGLCYQESVDHSRRQSENGGFCALTWLTGNPYKCEVNGDQLCDTEADPNIFPHNVVNSTAAPACLYSYNGNLDKYRFDNWGDAWAPPTRNIMSYSGPDCLTQFSRKQVAVMNYYILQFFNQNTFVYVDPEFDIYEPDNQFLSAGRIALNVDQLHTFHWQPDVNASGQAEACDEDWVAFTITTTNNYVIQTKEVIGKPAPDTQISLFSLVGGTLTLIQTNNDISSTNRFSRIMRSLNPAQYFLRVTQSEAYPAVGSRGHYSIQVSDGCYTFLNTAYAISGPNTICSSNATFNIANAPAGSTVTWNKSTNITYVSGQSTPSYIVKMGTKGNGFVTATVSTTACGSVPQLQKNVRVGGYLNTDYPITGPSNACKNQYLFYSTNSLPGATNYVWAWPSSWQYVYGQGTNGIDVKTTAYSTTGMMSVRVANICDAGGSPAVKYTNVGSCGSFSMSTYPNPAVDELIIETEMIEPETATERLSKNSVKNFSIKLRDSHGDLQKKQSTRTGKIVLSVADLKEGIYYIEIVTPETTFLKQVQIKR
jgi:hypothetical protein